MNAVSTERRPDQSSRARINMSGDMKGLVFQMSEGNPGAVSVLVQLLKDDPMGFMRILDLDDMGMRGSQIWVAYKDHCKQDIEVLKQALQDRDPAMVATVNASQGHSPNTPLAVEFGASSKHR